MKNFVWNSPNWWARIFRPNCRPPLDLIVESIQAHDAIVVFHACRPVDLGTYYRDGLLPSNTDQLNLLAQRIFSSVGCPTLDANTMAEVAASLGRSGDGEIHLGIDDRSLTEETGHYLIYGSEHLLNTAACLTSKLGFDFKNYLKSHGTPTLFTVTLPINLIPFEQIDFLAVHLQNKLLHEFDPDEDPPLTDFSFKLREMIPSTCIVGHRHPESIPDQHQHRQPYRFKDHQ